MKYLLVFAVLLAPFTAHCKDLNYWFDGFECDNAEVWFQDGRMHVLTKDFLFYSDNWVAIDVDRH